MNLTQTTLLLTLLIAGCGGGGSTTESALTPTPPVAAAPSQTGEIMIGITDAEGDFVTYAVDVLSISLARQNGDVVEALPLSTRVNFAELTELTEFLSIATVPVGTYNSVTLRLDYTDADILVEDAAGAAVAANVVDADGDPIGTVEVTLDLSSSDTIRITRGVPASLTLDFDLAATNQVDLTSSPPTVTAEPMLLATPSFETDREHRVRGLLQSVDETAATFELALRPFRHRTGRFGDFTVAVDADTRYDVDGAGFVGSDGLAALSQLDENALVVAMGIVANGGMRAQVVIAGASVPGASADVVRGVVSARTGDVLNVSGAVREGANGQRHNGGTYSVTIGDMTQISAPGIDPSMLASNSVSVGQRVVVWGEFIDDMTIDATAGRLRMEMNDLAGVVAQASPIAVDLYSLNGHRPDLYDFAGTGDTASNDADPDFYEIDTSVLPLPLVVDGDIVRMRGLTNAFGLAPPDFLARTVIDLDHSDRSAAVKTGWQEGTSTPFASVATDRIDVDLSAARKSLKVRGIPAGFFDDLETVAFIATDDGAGVYGIRVRGEANVTLYSTFEDLTEGLLAQLEAGNLLHRIDATGKYNIDSGELTAGRASFVFTTP